MVSDRVYSKWFISLKTMKHFRYHLPVWHSRLDFYQGAPPSSGRCSVKGLRRWAAGQTQCSRSRVRRKIRLFANETSVKNSLTPCCKVGRMDERSRRNPTKTSRQDCWAAKPTPSSSLKPDRGRKSRRTHVEWFLPREIRPELEPKMSLIFDS